MNPKFVALSTTVIGLLFATSVRPCSITRPVSSLEMVREAAVIVRATAQDYEVPPKNSQTFSTFMPDSQIRFKVLEVIRGKLSADYLLIHGTLVDRDDFNDHNSPYTFVRPGGRAGNCFALRYRSGAQFLLLLKKKADNAELTPYWYALGPTNEQLHSADDPWLLWVREEADKPRTSMKQPNRLSLFLTPV